MYGKCSVNVNELFNSQWSTIMSVVYYYIIICLRVGGGGGIDGDS